MKLNVPTLALISCVQMSAFSLQAEAAASLFISDNDLQSFKDRASQGVEPFSSVASSLNGVANSYLNSTPDPFYMSDVTKIDFGWCSSTDSTDSTFRELTNKLQDQSDKARNLALNYLVTGNETYARKAAAFLTAWAEKSSLLNLHDLNVNYTSASFDGLESGYCNNSWNMALDTIWQAYGLINFSDTYLILTENDYQPSSSDKKLWADWLRNDLLPATNSGFHAWTKWADAHTSSSVYTRYRSDNHLSWALAGITAAAAALDDDSLWSYALSGGSYNDGSGSYKNPSNFKSLVGYAIASSGRVYDQDERAPQHKGYFYANFSLWALSLTAMMAETHLGNASLWTYAGSSGGSVMKGYDYYSPFVAGDKDLEDSSETISPNFFRFMYEPLIGKSWVSGSRETAYTAARDSGSRTQFIEQAVGPYSLVTAGFESLSEPSAPGDLKARVVE